MSHLGVIRWVFNPGELKRRIQIERDTITRLAGVELRASAVYATCWAKAESTSGKESLVSQQVASDVVWMFTIRYRRDITPQDRIIYRDERMEIRAIIRDEINRDSILILCESRGVGPAITAAPAKGTWDSIKGNWDDIGGNFDDAGGVQARPWDSIPGNFDEVPGTIDEVR